MSLNWILLLLLVFFWGTSFSFTKIAVTALDPQWVVVSRLLIGAAILIVLLLVRRESLPRGRRIWTYLAIIALLGTWIPFQLIAWGQQFIPSGQAGVLMAVMPLIVLGLAPLFLKDEEIGLRRWAGFVVGFVGVGLLMGPEALRFSLETDTVAGQLSVLGGAVCYALAAIVSRRRPVSGALGSAAGDIGIAAVLGAILIVPMAGFEPLLRVQPVDPMLALSLAFLGLCATGLATWVYFSLVTRAGAAFLSLINYLIPIYALLLGAVWLGELPSQRELLGIVVIFAGLILAQARFRSS